MEKVSLLRVDSYEEDLKSKIIELVENIGGFKKYVKYGNKVLLKPNFVVANPVNSATNTHPLVIRAVCEILSDMGCSIAIGDSPMIGTGRFVAKALGLIDLLKDFNVKFIDFENPVQIDLSRPMPFERKYKNLTLAREIFEYDRIINLPKLKTHVQMGVTLANKNLFGCVVGQKKTAWHFKTATLDNFGRLIMEIAQTVNPALSIMDGIVGMDLNGPCNGRPRKTKVILASDNTTALDRVVIELIGKASEKIAIMRAAREINLPGTYMEEIEVVGDKIEDLKFENFRLIYLFPVDFTGVHFIYLPILKLFKQKMKVNYDKCIGCGRCEEVCGTGALKLDKNKKVKIDHKKCIRCCCCQEACPKGAIELHTPKILEKFYDDERKK